MKTSNMRRPFPTGLCSGTELNLLGVFLMDWATNYLRSMIMKRKGSMVNNLGWDPLELRRLRARLTMLFKIQQNLVAVPMPSVISVPVRSTPRHPHDFQHMYTSTNSCKYSFFIHTVHQWNLLPPSIASMASLSSFKAAMDSYSP